LALGRTQPPLSRYRTSSPGDEMRREVYLITHIYLLPGLNPPAAITSPEPIPVAAILLELWVRIPSGAWMSLSCERCVLSRQGLCEGITTRPEEYYRVWRV